MKKRAIYAATTLMLGGLIPLSNKNTQNNYISYEIYASGFLESNLQTLNHIKEEIIIINQRSNATSYNEYYDYINLHLEEYTKIANVKSIDFINNVLKIQTSDESLFCLKGYIYKYSPPEISTKWFLKDLFT